MINKRGKHSFLIFFFLLSLFEPNLAHAQDDDGGGQAPKLGDLSNSYDFQKLNGVDGRLAPHGNELMGDLVDKNTGAMTFEHTDVSIPGNSNLEVALRRKIRQGHSFYTPFQHGFGDWLLDIPIAYTAFAPNSIRGVLAPTFNQGCLTDYGPMRLDGRIGARSVSLDVRWPTFTSGVTLHVPGKGLSGFAAEPKKPQDPKTNWISAPNTTDHAGRCATQVIAPDGTKYKFGRHTFREAPAFKTNYWTNYNHSDYGDIYYEAQDEIARKYAVYLITEVEDVHGNWVRYDYANNARAELTRIHSNDGREIKLNYDQEMPGGRNSRRVSSVTAGSQTDTDTDTETWTYNYWRDFYLSKVILPDGRFWKFNSASGKLSLPDGEYHEVPRDRDGMILMFLDVNQSYKCLPTEFTVTIKHPDGALGAFKLRETRHIKNAFDLGFYDDDTDHYMVPRSIPLVTDNSKCAGTFQKPAFARPIGWPIHRVMSLVSKTISGSDIPTAAWEYEYRNYTGGSLDETWTNITEPDGTLRKYTYQTVGYHHGKLKRVDVTPVSGQGESFSYTYKGLVTPDRFRCVAGGSYGDSTGACLAFDKSPVKKIVRQRDGVTYNTEYDYNTVTLSGDWLFEYIDHGLPNEVTSYSTLQSARRVVDYDYWHNEDANIIGKTSKVTYNGKVFRDRTFTSKGQIDKEKRFGAFHAQYGYYNQGNIAWERDSLSRTWRWSTYHRGIARQITRPDGYVLTRSVDDFGRVTSITDALQNRTAYEYDSMGRLTLISPPTGWDPTEFSYSNLGAGVRQTMTHGDLVVTTQYDRMIRPISVKKDGGNGSSIYTSTDYDALGRVRFESWPSASSSPSTGVTTTYDGLGRITQSRENVAPYATTRTAYLSGNRTKVTDPEGNVTTTTLSGFGSPNDGQARLIASPENTTTAMTHDIYGNVLTVRQYGTHIGVTMDQTQRYSYDSRNRVCRHYVPEVGSKLFEYDSANQMIRYAEGQSGTSGCASISNSSAIVMSYDALSRNTGIDFPDATSDILKRFDANGNLISISRDGIDWDYEYNSLDLLSQELLLVDDKSFVVDYSYNSSGNLRSIKYPSGRDLQVSVDALGRMEQAGPYAKDAIFFPNDVLKRFTYGNNNTYNAALDSRQLPQEMRIANDGGVTRLWLGYDWDKNRNLQQLTDFQSSDANVNLDYDGLDRLTTANSWWGEGRISYDALGNIRSKRMGSQTLEYVYDSRNRLDQVTGAVEYGFAYDTRGNVTENGSRDFVYDLGNMMTGTSGLSFAYDGHNRRVKKTANGDTYFMYSQSGRLLHKSDPNGDTTDYIYLGDKLVAKARDQEGPSSGISYDNPTDTESAWNGFAYPLGHRNSQTTLRATADQFCIKKNHTQSSGSLTTYTSYGTGHTWYENGSWHDSGGHTVIIITKLTCV